MLNLLDNECVKVGQFLNCRFGRKLEMFLLGFTGLGVSVAEDEVDLGDSDY